MSTPFDLTPAETATLLSRAIAAKRLAYCRYSNFRVGACLLLADGTFHQGANIEVASSPCGVCAERCVLFYTVAQYRGQSTDVDAGMGKDGGVPLIRAVGVSSDIWPPASPCGLCRQALAEFCQPEMKVYMHGRAAGVPKQAAPEEELKAVEPLVMTMGQLLPMSFGSSDMDKREKKPPLLG